MLKISKLSDYAIVIMCELATQPKGVLSSRQLADKTGITEPTVIKLLKMLARNRLLVSERGRLGGYRLQHEPEQINLIDIISCIEGEISVTECDKSNHRCYISKYCKISSNWCKIGNILRLLLTRISLSDMLQDDFTPEYYLQTS